MTQKGQFIEAAGTRLLERRFADFDRFVRQGSLAGLVRYKSSRGKVGS